MYNKGTISGKGDGGPCWEAVNRASRNDMPLLELFVE